MNNINFDMTFGKYKGLNISDVPLNYLIWLLGEVKAGNKKDDLVAAYAVYSSSGFKLSLDSFRKGVFEVKELVHKKGFMNPSLISSDALSNVPLAVPVYPRKILLSMKGIVSNADLSHWVDNLRVWLNGVELSTHQIDSLKLFNQDLVRVSQTLSSANLTDSVLSILSFVGSSPDPTLLTLKGSSPSLPFSDVNTPSLAGTTTPTDILSSSSSSSFDPPPPPTSNSAPPSPTTSSSFDPPPPPPPTTNSVPPLPPSKHTKGEIKKVKGKRGSPAIPIAETEDVYDLPSRYSVASYLRDSGRSISPLSLNTSVVDDFKGIFTEDFEYSLSLGKSLHDYLKEVLRYGRLVDVFRCERGSDYLYQMSLSYVGYLWHFKGNMLEVPHLFSVSFNKGCSDN